MTGVFAKRPSLPKYTSIWDVNIVLSYINRMENTTLFQLSCKLCVLFLLLTAQRCQTLHLIQTDDIEFKDDTCLVHPNHLLKQSKPGHHLECIVLKEYKENQKQCIVQTLKEYLHRTAVLRSAEPKLLIHSIDQVFLRGSDLTPIKLPWILLSWYNIIICCFNIQLSVSATLSCNYSVKSEHLLKIKSFYTLFCNVAFWYDKYPGPFSYLHSSASASGPILLKFYMEHPLVGGMKDC